MSRLETVCEINAPIDMIWQILLDLGSYQHWCSSIAFADGSRVSQGSSVPIQTASPDGKGTLIQGSATFVTVDTCREFVWKTGLFPFSSNKHFWNLHTLSPVKTRLTHGEEFGGILGLFHGQSKIESYRPFYESINAELKKHAETRFNR